MKSASVLVDTSVWVDHFRSGNERFSSLLDDGVVLTHPFVIGELALGNMGNRGEILELIGKLPRVEVASDQEALAVVERHRLWGKGVGWIDVHLLASCLLSDARLFTLDKRLSALAASLLVNLRS